MNGFVATKHSSVQFYLVCVFVNKFREQKFNSTTGRKLISILPNTDYQ